MLVFAQWAAHLRVLGDALRAGGLDSLSLGGTLPESIAALQVCRYVIFNF